MVGHAAIVADASRNVHLPSMRLRAREMLRAISGAVRSFGIGRDHYGWAPGGPAYRLATLRLARVAAGYCFTLGLRQRVVNLADSRRDAHQAFDKNVDQFEQSGHPA